MARAEGHIGAVAFSRTGDQGCGEFANAVFAQVDKLLRDDFAKRREARPTCQRSRANTKLIYQDPALIVATSMLDGFVTPILTIKH